MKGITTITALLLAALVISLSSVYISSFIGGFSETYTFSSGDDTTYLNATENISLSVDKLQDKITGGNILETIWNSFSILGESISIYGSLAQSAAETLKIPLMGALVAIVLAIMTLIVWSAIARAITKQEI